MTFAVNRIPFADASSGGRRVDVLRSIGKASLVVALLLSSSTAAMASVLSGRVVRVVDGDTIVVLDDAHRQTRIRLAGIDAPERRQPFGERSREHLASLVAGKEVEVEWSKLDRYGRTVGKVLVGETDACLSQVQAGMAWWYRKYAGEQSVDDQRTYAATEESARREGAGLWSEPNPVAPWDFRRH